MADLRCENVSASYGARAVLAGVELTVPEGTLTAILGASGSGKTTLLRVVMGFVRADAGRVLVGGTVVEEAGGVHLRPEQRAVGYVAQEGALYPHLSVGENVGFGLGRAERKRGRRTDEVLALVGLGSEYAGRGVHELSGGEQRRVALARALAPGPRMVLLDEPFSGLDAALRAESRAAVSSALREAGTTAVLVTHDQAEALSMGREVGVLRDGRLVQVAAPAVLYRTPVDLDVAGFVGDAVVLPGRAGGGVVTCALGELALIDPTVQGEVEVMIRPEQISTGGKGARATVTGVTYYGPEIVIALELTGVTVSARAFSHHGVEVGETVALSVSGPVMAYPSGAARSAHASHAVSSTI
jgi:iron(III) transport system ATP-binding protein